MNESKPAFLFWKILICFIMSKISFGHAQEQYILKRVKGPVTLDGLSSEPAWEGIEPLPLMMRSPDYGQELTERTEILVGYDDHYLYVAGRLYDSQPSQIQSTATKRDDWKTSLDHIGIIIDTFNDNENGVIFVATPSGLRIDVTVQNDGMGAPQTNTNLSWNTFWDVETDRNGDGWFTEIRIPFSSLRFQDRNGRVDMGLTVYRWIPRKYEMAIFPPVELKHGFWGFLKPSQAHEIVIEGIRSRKPLYVAPYILGGFGQTFELNEGETAYVREDDPDFELGLDVKYGLTSNLTLDVTVNTDFAQVEADDQQINLTRFSLFFPEKRLFFQERSSNFEFNFDESNRLFYSRRIGIYDGKPVRIYGGGRVVGRVGPWDVGFLTMQTAPKEDLSSENFTVLRLRRRVINPSTYIGGIITNRVDLDGGYNTAYGLDGIFRLVGEDYFIFRWAQTFEDGLENDPASLKSARIYMNWERRSIKGFAYNLIYSRAGEAYNPEMGYERREDYTQLNGRILYGWIPGEQSAMLAHWILTEGFLFLRNPDNSMESAQFGPGWEFETKSGYTGKISANVYYEDLLESFDISDDIEVPVGQYTSLGLEGRLSTPSGRRKDLVTNLRAGSFYDGWCVTLGFTPRWNVSPNLELSGFYQINKLQFKERGQELLAHVGRFKALVMLNVELSISAFLQYNSMIDKIIANIRFRYNPREGNDFYLVYDEGFNTDRYREVPFLPVRSNRAAMLKYTYTFNL